MVGTTKEATKRQRRPKTGLEKKRWVVEKGEAMSGEAEAATLHQRMR